MFARATVDDAAALGAMHVQAWRETYAGLAPDAVLAALDPGQRGERWRHIIAGGALVLLLRDEAGIAGFGSAGPQRDGRLVQSGEISALYLLRRVQRQGHGRRLIAALARSLLRLEPGGVSLWVLDGNAPARRFYEALAGRPALSEIVERDGWIMAHTAYVWDDVAALLPRPTTADGCREPPRRDSCSC
jgi:GNAT superfamily N-acetyltransferase